MPFRLKRRTEVPVLHGRECGLRGRLAGKRGALPPLVNHPRRGRLAGARDRKQICPHSVEKFDLRLRRGSFVLRLTREAGVLTMYGLSLLFP